MFEIVNRQLFFRFVQQRTDASALLPQPPLKSPFTQVGRPGDFVLAYFAGRQFADELRLDSENKVVVLKLRQILKHQLIAVQGQCGVGCGQRSFDVGLAKVKRIDVRGERDGAFEVIPVSVEGRGFGAGGRYAQRPEVFAEVDPAHADDG